MSISGNMKIWAKRIKRDGVTLWFAGKNPRTPWHAKALGVFVVAYALSPIDLIPDFIPVLGYVDDVLLLPGLIWLTIKLLPPEVLAECRVQADDWMQTKGAKPISRVGAVLIVLLWLAIGAATWFWLRSRMQALPEFRADDGDTKACVRIGSNLSPSIAAASPLSWGESDDRPPVMRQQFCNPAGGLRG